MRFLLYFVKWPEPGKVKTRLAKDVGATAAAAIYRELAEANFRNLLPLKEHRVSLVVCFDPPEAEAKIKSWLPKADLFLAQSGGDLGARLRIAFDFFALTPALSQEGEGETRFSLSPLGGRGEGEGGEARRVIAAGSDTMGLQAELIDEGFEALKGKDLVLGPAKDGGYYLIGLSRPEPGLFQNVPWSTSAVLETTLARARGLGLSYRLLAPLEDLDEAKSIGGARHLTSVPGTTVEKED